jgi:hypothetical protein
MKPTQRVRLIALLSSIAGAAGAQTAPAPVVTPAAPAVPPAPAAPPAPAPAPAVPAAPAPVALPAAAPAPAEPPAAAPAPAAPAPLAPSIEPTPAEWPPPPAPPIGSSPTSAGRVLMGASWNVAFPLGSVRDFTGATSAAGFEFLVRYFALPQLSLGASTDFQTFIQTRPRTTYQIDNGAVTATAYNSVQNAAVRVSAHYYFLKDGPALPYAGANIGLGWSTFQSAAADLAIYDNQTSILLGADVGALFPLANSKLAFVTAVRYSTLPAADFLRVTNVQSLTLQVGVLAL